MKKSIKTFVSICAVYLLAASSAYAEPAIILTEFGCGLLDGDGNGVFTTDTKVVNTVGKNGGNINQKCYARVTNETGSSVKWNYENTGYLCGTQFGSTEDWRSVVDSEGNATLTCKVRF